MTDTRAQGRLTSQSNPLRVLLVDDDFRFLATLKRALTVRGLEVEAVETPGEALPYLEKEWPQVVALDVAMPGIDGVSFCRLVRDRFPVPILMLTARDSVPDRVAGLEAGADDYVVKPVALDELIARLRALARRPPALDHVTAEVPFGSLALDSARWKVFRDGEELKLTATEFLILEALLNEAGRVVSRDRLLTLVWGDSSGFDSNVVDVHVSNLRRKLEAGGRPRVIETVRRAGYRLVAM